MKKPTSIDFSPRQEQWLRQIAAELDIKPNVFLRQIVQAVVTATAITKRRRTIPKTRRAMIQQVVREAVEILLYNIKKR